MAYSVEGANRLIDELKDKYQIKSEREFAKLIGTVGPNLWRIRNGFNRLGDCYIIAIHEVFDIPIKEIKERING